MDNWFILIWLPVFIGIYFLPTIVAFRRKHSYKNIIAVINLIFGLTGVGWAVSMIWAIWPTEKTFIDPLVGNPTGIGKRNTGNTTGEASASHVNSFLSDEGVSAGINKVAGGIKEIFSSGKVSDELNKLVEMRNNGDITQEEFESLKKRLIK